MPDTADWTGQVADRAAQWRGELHPVTGELLAPWPPGTADRMWLVLRTMATGS